MPQQSLTPSTQYNLSSFKRPWTNTVSGVTTSGTNTFNPRSDVVSKLRQYGLSSNYLDQLNDDQLMELLKTQEDKEENYRDRTRDRTDTMNDFTKQLDMLTGSKQRQAEQAGRIQQKSAATQGLAQMMSNF